MCDPSLYTIGLVHINNEQYSQMIVEGDTPLSQLIQGSNTEGTPIMMELDYLMMSKFGVSSPL